VKDIKEERTDGYQRRREGRMHIKEGRREGD
jgi:hypothetical protein